MRKMLCITAIAALTASGGLSGCVMTSGDDRGFVIDPELLLDYSSTYEVIVLSTIADRSGNTLGSDVTRSFTTEPAPPLQITSASPTSVVGGSVVVIYGDGFDTEFPAFPDHYTVNGPDFGPALVINVLAHGGTVLCRGHGYLEDMVHHINRDRNAQRASHSHGFFNCRP